MSKYSNDRSDTNDNFLGKLAKTATLISAGSALLFNLYAAPAFAKQKYSSPQKPGPSQSSTQASKPSKQLPNKPKQIYSFLDERTAKAYMESVKTDEITADGWNILDNIILQSQKYSHSRYNVSSERLQNLHNKDYTDGEISQLELGIFRSQQKNKGAGINTPQTNAYIRFQISHDKNSAKSIDGVVISEGKEVIIVRVPEQSLTSMYHFLNYVKELAQKKSQTSTTAEEQNHAPDARIIFTIDGKNYASFSENGAIFVPVPKTENIEGKNISLELLVKDEEGDKTSARATILKLDKYMRREIGEHEYMSETGVTSLVPTEEAIKISENLGWPNYKDQVMKKAIIFDGRLNSDINNYQKQFLLWTNGKTETAIGNYIVLINVSDNAGNSQGCVVPLYLIPEGRDVRKGFDILDLLNLYAAGKTILSTLGERSNVTNNTTITNPAPGGITGGQTDVNGIKP
ncbi:MAG TPA: hypothetical protein VI894_01035 [Candidatus Nanoarchaeia archaeon]|nr:hypothetical protein [Candidatus Nanoarchaeia archaeon]